MTRQLDLLLALVLLLVVRPPGLDTTNDFVDLKTVKAWTDKISFELVELGKYVTNIEKFHQNYKEVEVKIIDGKSLVDTISKQIEVMMNAKIGAVSRIAEVAEQKAMDASTSEIPEEDPTYQYKDAKNYSSVPTAYSDRFGGEVNLNFSAVHVPTTVYGRGKETLHAIQWSEELDQTFINNYNNDPSLSWQYFGSSTGFMRQFPAIHWKLNGSNPHDPDLFDCRTRSWFIEAATSPKDVLILVDTSGSMTGIRKEIARHVVNNILDTLGNNDYVNIIKFSNITEQVVPCFGDGLVQANLANIRELKNGISEMNTERIANFSMIFTYAFELLEEMRMRRVGACCNQAIMLVTDGVPESHQEIFQRYNWATNLENPDMADMPVRIFTYVIGREVTDVRDSRWTACANRGYFVHLSTLAEVREQVLNYISVMARPLVLNGTYHPKIWTPVYADIADPKITDWLWDKKERNDQKERYWIYRRNQKFKYLRKELEEYVKKSRKHPASPSDLHKYRLMTSVSTPVYDKRENANITEQVLVKNAYWVEQTRETRIASLLGVAGIDVPVDDIKQLMMPHMLGVHGYAFIVTNNGYVLIHPDLRPVFQGILKPAYNSVDMAELELVDGDDFSREFSEIFLTFRENVVNQEEHSDVHLITKYHYDDMKRAGKIRRKYDSAPIKGTPFTLVVSLPIFNHAGATYRVHAPKDVRRLSLDAGINAAKFFEGKNWRIHPDWLYCKYHFDNAYTFDTPEEELRHFLTKATQPLWKWGTFPSTYEQSSQSNKKGDENKDRRYCDRDLILNLVFDAEVTKFFADPQTSRDQRREQFRSRFGPLLAFVATRSGLTRWQNLVSESESPNELPYDHFSNLYPRAVDEVWYKRAVEQHYVNPEAFVFSIPVDEDGATESTLVTASRAIFVGNDSMKAPAAVAGFQMNHTALQKLFQNITYVCTRPECRKHCGDDDLDCYLVDNHGYIVAAKEASKAGQFLGNVHGIVMNDLVVRGVFEKITVFDYQAVCFRNTQETSDGSILLTPFKKLAMAGSWAYAHLAMTLAKAGFWSYEYAEAVTYNDGEMELDRVTEHEEPESDFENDPNYQKPAAENKDDTIYDNMIRIKRTRPEPCDQKIELYSLRNASGDPEYDNANEGIVGCDHLKYTFLPVNDTNMILLVIDRRDCQTVEFKMSVEPQEIVYHPANASSLACQKTMNNLFRKRLPDCIRSHPRESEIKDLCGRAPGNSHPGLLLVTSLLVLLLVLNHRVC